MTMLQGGDDVFQSFPVVRVSTKIFGPADVERQFWPDMEKFPRRCFLCAVKFQIETEWCIKHDTSPSSAYVHQLEPSLWATLMLLLKLFLDGDQEEMKHF